MARYSLKNVVPTGYLETKEIQYSLPSIVSVGVPCSELHTYGKPSGYTAVNQSISRLPGGGHRAWAGQNNQAHLLQWWTQRLTRDPNGIHQGPLKEWDLWCWERWGGGLSSSWTRSHKAMGVETTLATIPRKPMQERSQHSEGNKAMIGEHPIADISLSRPRSCSLSELDSNRSSFCLCEFGSGFYHL